MRTVAPSSFSHALCCYNPAHLHRAQLQLPEQHAAADNRHVLRPSLRINLPPAGTAVVGRRVGCTLPLLPPLAVPVLRLLQLLVSIWLSIRKLLSLPALLPGCCRCRRRTGLILSIAAGGLLCD